MFNYIHAQIKPHVNIINVMNILKCDCEYHYNTQYDVVGWLVMGLSEKSGWGQKFSTLEPPGFGSLIFKARQSKTVVCLTFCTHSLTVVR